MSCDEYLCVVNVLVDCGVGIWMCMVILIGGDNWGGVSVLCVG